MTKRPQPTHRRIYVIDPAEGMQKVGIATNPKARMAALLTARLLDLMLHVSIAVPFNQALAVERRAYRLLVRSCIRNEWFETTPVLAMAAVERAAKACGRVVVPQRRPVRFRSSRSQRLAGQDQTAASPPAPATADPHLGQLPLFGFGREGREEQRACKRTLIRLTM